MSLKTIINNFPKIIKNTPKEACNFLKENKKWIIPAIIMYGAYKSIKWFSDNTAKYDSEKDSCGKAPYKLESQRNYMFTDSWESKEEFDRASNKKDKEV